jgi:putative endonuclease
MRPAPDSRKARSWQAMPRVEGLHVACVYIARCSDGTLYIGHTRDLPSRERAHNAGLGSLYTAKRRPVTIVYSEKCLSLADAVARERQIKRWTAQKKEALVAGDVPRLKSLSRRHQ